MNNYTEEQKKDIEVRQLEAVEYLKSKELSLSYIIVKTMVDEPNQVWGDKVQLYFSDTKFNKPNVVVGEKIANE